MTIDLFRVRIHTLEVPNVGLIHYKRPSAAMSKRVAAIQLRDETEAQKGFSLLAELISTCLCDEHGKRIFADADAALEMDTEAFSAIGMALLGVVKTTEDAEKNSPSTPSESLPTD